MGARSGRLNRVASDGEVAAGLVGELDDAGAVGRGVSFPIVRKWEETNRRIAKTPSIRTRSIDLRRSG